MYYAPEDVMRTASPRIGEGDKVSIDTIKGMGQNFYNMLEQLPASREMSLAKTKIEEAVMWAVKGVTK